MSQLYHISTHIYGHGLILYFQSLDYPLFTFIFPIPRSSVVVSPSPLLRPVAINFAPLPPDKIRHLDDSNPQLNQQSEECISNVLREPGKKLKQPRSDRGENTADSLRGSKNTYIAVVSLTQAAQ